MTRTETDLLKTLHYAIANVDRSQVDQSVEQLKKRAFQSRKDLSGAFAFQVLKTLRQGRYFLHMCALADIFLRGANEDPQIHRQYAQALIELGHLSAALQVLKRLISRLDRWHPEWPEAKGLIGRVHKQFYLATSERSPEGRESLKKALRAYGAVYEESESLWHGVNLLALLASGREQGHRLRQYPKTKDLATKVLRAAKHGKADHWTRASEAEAHVALGDFKAALAAANQYVSDPDTDAFAVASTLRQFQDLWQLGHSGTPGGELITFLKAALLKKEQGSASFHDLPAEGLEAKFDDGLFVNYAWYETGLNRCHSIACLQTLMGVGKGTGVLVRGGDFFPQLGDEMLLLTNAHVMAPADSNSVLSVDTAQVFFQVNKSCRRLKTVLWSSPVPRLDATFARFDPPLMEGRACPLSSIPIQVSQPAKERVYVIGHPGGHDLSFSLNDNLVLDTDGIKLHYRTPTTPGSSGSPVFEQDRWRMVALHHRGLEKMPRLNNQPGWYQANEGISIHEIQKETRAFQLPS